MRLLLILPALLVGCAYNRPHLTETITVYSTNGTKTVTVREASVRTYAIFTSTDTMAKQRATIGKTLSVGTEGLNQEAISTNGLAALIELRKIADDAAKISATGPLPIP